MKRLPLWLMASALLSTALGAQEPHATTPPAPGESAQRNVILIVGDGMDDQQITIARNYLVGAQGKLLLDNLPMRGAVQILSIEDEIGGKPVYVSDSANTATSMATGEVTSRGRLSTRAGDNAPYPTIVELAESRGYRTGLVSTASVTDATPASFAVHMSMRLCQSPELMQKVTYGDIELGNCASETRSQGGRGSISEQLAESDLDVLFGGGGKYFAPSVEGEPDLTVLELAIQRGFTAIYSREDLLALESTDRVLGLFSEDTMPVRMRGEDGREAESPEPSWLNSVHRYLGEVTQPAIMRCEPNPDFGDMPSLAEMTEAALSVLHREDSPGFFLMVESASIDKQAHYRKPCGSIGELEQLEEALASALAFADKHPDTLILVTADHSQAAQLVPMKSLYASFPIPIFTPGKLARIQTPEGSTMAVNYATNNFSAEEHTGANVPIFGNTEAVGKVPTFLSQPEIFNIMSNYLGLD